MNIIKPKGTLWINIFVRTCCHIDLYSFTCYISFTHTIHRINEISLRVIFPTFNCLSASFACVCVWSPPQRRTHGFQHWTLQLAHLPAENNALWLASQAKGQQLWYPRSASSSPHSKSWSGFRNIHALTHIHRLFKGCAVLSCRFNWYGNDTGFTRWTSLLSLKKFLFEDFFSSLRSKRLIGVWVSMNPVVLMSFMVIFITSHKELLMA